MSTSHFAQFSFFLSRFFYGLEFATFYLRRMLSPQLDTLLAPTVDEEEAEMLLALKDIMKVETPKSGAGRNGTEGETSAMLLMMKETNSTTDNEEEEGMCFCPCDAANATRIPSNETVEEMMKNRDARQFRLQSEEDEEEETMQEEEDNGASQPSQIARRTFGRYIRRLRTIYELDIRFVLDVFTNMFPHLLTIIFSYFQQNVGATQRASQGGQRGGGPQGARTIGSSSGLPAQGAKPGPGLAIGSGRHDSAEIHL